MALSSSIITQPAINDNFMGTTAKRIKNIFQSKADITV